MSTIEGAATASWWQRWGAGAAVASVVGLVIGVGGGLGAHALGAFGGKAAASASLSPSPAASTAASASPRPSGGTSAPDDASVGAHWPTVADPTAGVTDAVPMTRDALANIGDLWQLEEFGVSDFDKEAATFYLRAPDGTRYQVSDTVAAWYDPEYWDVRGDSVLLRRRYHSPDQFATLDLATGAITPSNPPGWRDDWQWVLVPLAGGQASRPYWANNDATPIVFTWSRDGWSQVAVLGGVTYGQVYNARISPDGEWIAIPGGPDDGGIAVTRLGDTLTSLRRLPVTSGDCQINGWDDASTFTYSCWNYADSVQATFQVEVAADGSLTATSVANPQGETTPQGPGIEPGSYVDYQVPGTPLVLHSSASDGTLQGLSALTSTGEAEIPLPPVDAGLHVADVREMREGTYAISFDDRDWDGLVLVVDVEAGVAIEAATTPPAGNPSPQGGNVVAMLVLSDDAGGYWTEKAGY